MKNVKQTPLVGLAICAMLSAMSFVLMLLEFPVTPPAMGHLKMDFSAFVVPFSFVLRRKEEKMKDTKTLLAAGICGVMSIVLIGIAANYFVAPLFFKYFLNIEIGGDTLVTAVVSATALNAIKGVMLAVVAFPLVKGMLDAVKKIV